MWEPSRGSCCMSHPKTQQNNGDTAASVNRIHLANPVRFRIGFSSMKTFSVAEQVASQLRKELMQERWKEAIPGRDRLARELGVHGSTVERALQQLEREGLLKSGGIGKRRRVVIEKTEPRTGALRIAIMLHDSNYRTSPFMVELCHQLEIAGQLPFFPNKTLSALDQSPERLTRFMKEISTDAWLISSGSKELLSSVVALGKPAFALFGRHAGLPIAGARPDKSPTMAQLTQRLISLRHRRISFICACQIRYPKKAKVLEHFLNELEAAGIRTGEYNCPDWEETQNGFIKVLDSLFSSTPPTALILDEGYMFHAAYHYVSQRGLKVPQDVSMICMDDDPGFHWCHPAVTHITWDPQPIVRQVVRWADNVAKGKVDHRQILSKAQFVVGGSIGPA